MGTSAVPDLIDALVTRARVVLPSLIVHDGFGVTDAPGDYLMIGVEDPDIPGFTASATAQQSWANANGGDRDEEGDVRCAALSRNGNGNEAGQKNARDAAYATTAALEDMLRTDPAVGVPALLWTSFGTSSELSQIQDGDGSTALILFSVHFRARI